MTAVPNELRFSGKTLPSLSQWTALLNSFIPIALFAHRSRSSRCLLANRIFYRFSVEIHFLNRFWEWKYISVVRSKICIKSEGMQLVSVLLNSLLRVSQLEHDETQMDNLILLAQKRHIHCQRNRILFGVARRLYGTGIISAWFFGMNNSWPRTSCSCFWQEQFRRNPGNWIISAVI